MPRIRHCIKILQVFKAKHIEAIYQVLAEIGLIDDAEKTTPEIGLLGYAENTPLY